MCGGALFQDHVDVPGLAVAPHGEYGGVARSDGRDGLGQVAGVGHGSAVDRQDHVAGLHARLGGRVALECVGHDHALGTVKAQGGGGFLVQVLHLDAQPAALHALAGLQLFDDLLGHGGGDGEAEPLARGDDGRVDAHHLAVQVDQRSAGVARVDGRVGLDEVVVGTGPEHPALGRDDACGDRVAQAEGVADGQDPGPDLELVGVREFQHVKRAAGLDLDQRQVGFPVRADDLGREFLAVLLELDRDGVRAFDDVVVGHDVAVRADDEAGTQGGLLRGDVLLREELVRGGGSPACPGTARRIP